jgi:hypothetical protein
VRPALREIFPGHNHKRHALPARRVDVQDTGAKRGRAARFPGNIFWAKG